MMTPAAWYVRGGKLHIKQGEVEVTVERAVWIALAMFILQHIRAADDRSTIQKDGTC